MSKITAKEIREEIDFVKLDLLNNSAFDNPKEIDECRFNKITIASTNIVITEERDLNGILTLLEYLRETFNDYKLKLFIEDNKWALYIPRKDMPRSRLRIILLMVFFGGFNSEVWTVEKIKDNFFYGRKWLRD